MNEKNLVRSADDDNGTSSGANQGGNHEASHSDKFAGSRRRWCIPSDMVVVIALDASKDEVPCPSYVAAANAPVGPMPMENKKAPRKSKAPLYSSMMNPPHSVVERKTSTSRGAYGYNASPTLGSTRLSTPLLPSHRPVAMMAELGFDTSRSPGICVDGLEQTISPSFVLAEITSDLDGDATQTSRTMLTPMRVHSKSGRRSGGIYGHGHLGAAKRGRVLSSADFQPLLAPVPVEAASKGESPHDDRDSTSTPTLGTGRAGLQGSVRPLTDTLLSDCGRVSLQMVKSARRILPCHTQTFVFWHCKVSWLPEFNVVQSAYEARPGCPGFPAEVAVMVSVGASVTTKSYKEDMHEISGRGRLTCMHWAWK
nr:hypothetical protein CFP56_32177 [Quercus suber]